MPVALASPEPAQAGDGVRLALDARHNTLYMLSQSALLGFLSTPARLRHPLFAEGLLD